MTKLLYQDGQFKIYDSLGVVIKHFIYFQYDNQIIVCDRKRIISIIDVLEKWLIEN